jgi:hypothetical protein
VLFWKFGWVNQKVTKLTYESSHSSIGNKLFHSLLQFFSYLGQSFSSFFFSDISKYSTVHFRILLSNVLCVSQWKLWIFFFSNPSQNTTLTLMDKAWVKLLARPTTKGERTRKRKHQPYEQCCCACIIKRDYICNFYWNKKLFLEQISFFQIY